MNLTATEKYVLRLAVLLMGTCVVFAWVGESRITLAIAVFTCEVLALDQLSVHLGRRERRAIVPVEGLLVAAFVVVVIVEVMRILSK